MIKYDRKKAAGVLRAYPAMKNALCNLEEQIQAEGDLLTACRRHTLREKELYSAKEHLFIYENLILQRNLVATRLRAIERSLSALDEKERSMLTSFFLEPYDRDTPFALMEQYGYEKSQLYYYRSRALDRFAQNYGGLEVNCTDGEAGEG